MFMAEELLQVLSKQRETNQKNDPDLERIANDQIPVRRKHERKKKKRTTCKKVLTTKKQTK